MLPSSPFTVQTGARTRAGTRSSSSPTGAGEKEQETGCEARAKFREGQQQLPGSLQLGPEKRFLGRQNSREALRWAALVRNAGWEDAARSVVKSRICEKNRVDRKIFTASCI